jgi:hypothetical protein
VINTANNTKAKKYSVVKKDLLITQNVFLVLKNWTNVQNRQIICRTVKIFELTSPVIIPK